MRDFGQKIAKTEVSRSKKNLKSQITLCFKMLRKSGSAHDIVYENEKKTLI